MHKKTKGSVAELVVAARLMRDGWHVLIPYGENTRYDLVAERDGRFVRIQVKYVTPKNGTLEVNCQSSNNWSVLPYSSKEIDVIAVYNPTDQQVHYVPSAQIRKSKMKLRLTDTKNGQRAYVRFAREFPDILCDRAIEGRYQSGQLGQTVNLVAHAFRGSNPLLPIFFSLDS